MMRENEVAREERDCCGLMVYCKGRLLALMMWFPNAGVS
jgi:hypothetical protein